MYLNVTQIIFSVLVIIHTFFNENGATSHIIQVFKCLFFSDSSSPFLLIYCFSYRQTFVCVSSSSSDVNVQHSLQGLDGRPVILLPIDLLFFAAFNIRVFSILSTGLFQKFLYYSMILVNALRFPFLILACSILPYMVPITISSTVVSMYFVIAASSLISLSYYWQYKYFCFANQFSILGPICLILVSRETKTLEGTNDAT